MKIYNKPVLQKNEDQVKKSIACTCSGCTTHKAID